MRGGREGEGREGEGEGVEEWRETVQGVAKLSHLLCPFSG